MGKNRLDLIVVTVGILFSAGSIRSSHAGETTMPIIAFSQPECPAGWIPFTKAEGRFVLGASATHKFDSLGGAETHTHGLVHDTATRKPAHIQEAVVRGDARANPSESMPPFIALNYCKKE
jgi:hypothetical protein